MSLFQSNDNVQSLRQQLASTQAKLQEYTDIIISQANELRILRANICQNCKMRFTPSPESGVGTASSSVVIRPHSSPSGHKPFWRRMLLQPFPTKRPDLGFTPPSVHASNLTLIPAPLPTLKFSPVEHFPPQTSKSATIVPVPAPETPISPEKIPEWLVEYRKTESRTVDVTFVRAYKQEANVNSIRFSPDGRYLAASMVGFSGKISIYGVDNAKETRVLRESPLSQNDRLGLWYLCFSPDGRNLATTGSDDRVRLWEIPEKRVRSTYGMSASVHILDISPNGRFLACASYLGIIMWRIRDGSKKIFTDSSTYAYSFIRFTPNGLYIVTVDFQDTLRIWNIRTGHLIGRWAHHESNALRVKSLRARYHESQRFWTISSIGEDTAVENQEEILLFTCHRRSHAVAVSADGRWVLSGSVDGDTHIFDSRDGLQQCSLLGHTDGIASVDFSPLGGYLAIGKGSYVTLWSYKHRAN